MVCQNSRNGEMITSFSTKVQTNNIVHIQVVKISSYLCNLKLITVILSIYFLALNTVPCNDSGDVKEDSKTVSVIDYNGDQDCELCSPFCHCHCCHVFTIDFGLAAFEPLQPIISQKNFAHFDNFGKDISRSLFQPPRV